ncbi:MAG: hypothetical protein RIB98_07700 [Acidimicrobiales bacterium]
MITSTDIAGFDARFAELARRWDHHQNLRRSGASVPELARSRQALDAARAGFRR